ncbi:peptidoglycan editing factor PgeF [Aquifex pyrophilus]
MSGKNLSEGEKTKVILELRIKNALVRLSGKVKAYLPIQRHTDRVIKLLKPQSPLVGDAVITNLRNYPIGVKTADCVPIALVGEKWVGVIHAGWRGLHKGIIEKAVKLLKEEGEKELTAVVLPSAKSCCYEVGGEFENYGFKSLERREGKLYLDTQREAILRLKESGVSSLIVWEKCTICSPELPSYRRDKTMDRIITSVVLL